MSTADYPVWLAIMPDQRDAARADAGKHPDGGNAITWSGEDQLWYARPGADLSRLSAWMPDAGRRSGGGDPETEFLDALTDAGLIIDGLPVMDGEIHRVSVTDGPKGNGDGVYRGFLNGTKPGGWFINYWTAKTHKDITKWKATGGESDPVARLHMRAVARQFRDDSARKLAATHARQTAKAKALYERLPPAEPDHDYLQRKGVTADADIRQTRNGALVIPLQDVNGEFRTLQYIPPDGEKYLFSEAPKAGHFKVVGGGLRDGEPILYAEGYATARSLNEVTGLPVVMTIDAGNMLNVADVLNARYPTSPHLFMIDFDHSKSVNTGLVMGKQAALNTGGAVIAPDFLPAERSAGMTDFNDIHQSRGAEALRADLLPRIHQALAGLNYKETVMATPDDVQPAPDNLPAASPDSVESTPSRRSGTAKEKTDEVLKLRDEGLNAGKIAEQLGIGQSSVYRILKAQKAETAAETGAVEFANTQGDSAMPATDTVPGMAGDASPAPAVSGSPSDAVTPELASTAGTVPAPEPQASPERADDVARAAALSASGLSLARVAAEMNLGMTETHRLLLQGEANARENLKKNEEKSAVPPGALLPDMSGTERTTPESHSEFSKAFDDIAGRMRTLINEADKQNPDEVYWKTGELITEWRVLAGVWSMSDEHNKGWEHFPGKECETLEAQLKALAEGLPETHPETADVPVQPASPLTATFGEENAIQVGAPRVSPQDEDDPVTAKTSRIDADGLLSRITHEMQPDGKSVLYRLDGDPAFLDRGNRLVMAEGASAHEEKVLAALLTAANHYQGRIELTGSDEFKAFAIGVIVANKLDVSMKNAGQQADLDAARRAAGQPVTPAAPADAVRGDPVAPAASSAPPVVPEPAAAERTDGGAHNTADVTMSPTKATPKPTPTDEARVPSAVHTPAEKAQVPVTGKVTACGQAPFRFDPNEAESTFITLRTKEGPQTFWGKELAGLLRETNLKPGRMVTLQWMGKQPVTVKVPQRNGEGVVTHYESREANRNQWSLAPVGGDRVQTGGSEMVKLAAFDASRYAKIQQTVVSRLGLDMPPPPVPADGLYWFSPDGQGSSATGDALSAARPEQDGRAGTAVMSSWDKNGSPDLYLVQGDGNYLQGVMRHEGAWQHVLVSLPGSKEAPPMVVNMLTPEGAVPVGSGNGINRSGGQPVPREHVVVRLTGEEKPRIAKLDAPADVPPALHARLGYDERYKAEAGWVKDQPAAAPQATPVTPPRPAQ